MKSFVLILILFAQVSIASPNEERIYYHLHQATRWAELEHQQGCLIAQKNMENHLAKVKYSEPKLVYSKFYKDYLFIRDLTFDDKAEFQQIEGFREKLHSKAEKLKVKHPVNWREEFVICL